jgi:hypothetical protein
MPISYRSGAVGNFGPRTLPYNLPVLVHSDAGFGRFLSWSGLFKMNLFLVNFYCMGHLDLFMNQKDWMDFWYFTVLDIRPFCNIRYPARISACIPNFSQDVTQKFFTSFSLQKCPFEADRKFQYWPSLFVIFSYMV